MLQLAAEKQREAMDAEGNFALAQRSGANEEFLEGAKDINVMFSITARSKDLFVNANLKITAGRRYGLVGPNG